MERRMRKTWIIAAVLLMSITFMAKAPTEKTGSIAHFRGFSSASSADLAAGWSKTYGGTNDDEAWSIVQTSDGGYALVGAIVIYSINDTCIDSWLVKTDSAGNMQCNRTYGGAGTNELFSIVQTSDGGFALAGHTDSFGVGGSDFWLVKTDSAGNMQWNQTYGGVGVDVAFSIVQTSDGGYALAGYTISFNTYPSYDFWLVKVDSVGVMQWNETYGGTGAEEAYSIIQTSDGGYALAGYTNLPIRMPNDAFWLVKTDSFGRQQWNQTYGSFWDQDYASSIVQTGDGGYALAGFSKASGNSLLVKTDSTGNMEWSQSYTHGGEFDYLLSLIQASDGGYALAGITENLATYGYKAWFVKTDSIGNVQWNQTYGGSGYNYAESVIQTSDGGYALGGGTSSFGASGNDFWLIKTDAGGDLHDVAVVGATSDKTVVGEGFNDNVTVTVANEGTYNETFTVTAYANGTAIGMPQPLTLLGGDSTKVVFVWTTISSEKGNYIISAFAQPIPGETNTANNNCTGGVAIVTMAGDVNNDGKVDGRDLIIMARAFGTFPGYTLWNPDADINNDGKVDGRDLVIVARHFGEGT
jgi:hypothetical protein